MLGANEVGKGRCSLPLHGRALAPTGCLPAPGGSRFGALQSCPDYRVNLRPLMHGVGGGGMFQKGQRGEENSGELGVRLVELTGHVALSHSSLAPLEPWCPSLYRGRLQGCGQTSPTSHAVPRRGAVAEHRPFPGAAATNHRLAGLKQRRFIFSQF